MPTTIKQPQYSIIAVISDMNFVGFQKKEKEFREQNRRIIRSRRGVSMIALPAEGGIALTAVPYLYVEFECTQEEHAAWAFRTTMMP